MNVQLVNFVDVHASIGTITTLLTTPSTFSDWMSTVVKVVQTPDAIEITRDNSFFNPHEHMRIQAHDGIVRFISTEGLVQYQVIFRPMSFGPNWTTIYQLLILTQPPTIPLTLLRPFLQMTFNTDLAQFARYAEAITL
ncbi:hypothetical protein ACFQ5J_10620 [Lacticaseibacillus baoqingensis]|uniref:SRPBCC family protein n=1 Tax=Lacticaseibacillus baoqingensis TaxID=2486013 RepID=A0ABW4E983_9LACO|nr:hypothetical protein [Lacticaseibacillus baoqingensis]